MPRKTRKSSTETSDSDSSSEDTDSSTESSSDSGDDRRRRKAPSHKKSPRKKDKTSKTKKRKSNEKREHKERKEHSEQRAAKKGKTKSGDKDKTTDPSQEKTQQQKRDQSDKKAPERRKAKRDGTNPPQSKVLETNQTTQQKAPTPAPRKTKSTSKLAGQPKRNTSRTADTTLTSKLKALTVMYSQYQNGRQPAAYDEAQALGILQHLDKEELGKLLEDDFSLNELINDLQQVKDIEADRETLLASNKSVADYNLSKEPKLEQAKTQLAAAYEEGVSRQKTYEQNKQKVDFLAAQQSLDTTLALLQTESAKTEEESEEMSDSFLDGNMEVEDFVEAYIQKRTQCHLRKVKAEKMHEILQSRRHHNPVVQSAYTYPATPTSNNCGPAPYPIGNFGMPNHMQYMPR